MDKTEQKLKKQESKTEIDYHVSDETKVTELTNNNWKRNKFDQFKKRASSFCDCNLTK